MPVLFKIQVMNCFPQTHLSQLLSISSDTQYISIYQMKLILLSGRQL